MATVSLMPCDRYDRELIKEKIELMMEDLGGFQAYFRPGERVFIKTNLLMKKKPEEATTTHPTVVAALADYLVERGLEVVVGDSPGGPFTEKNLREIYEACGLHGIMSESIPLNWNTDAKDVAVDASDGCRLLRRITYLAALDEVDHVITAAKLKTHSMMTFTGAVKNLFGIVPGLLKVEYHMKMPEERDFAAMLVDLVAFKRPTLSLIDGIEGMEGAGPSAGVPIRLNRLVLSDDPHAADLVTVGTVGIPETAVPTLVEARERGFFDTEPRVIDHGVDPVIMEMPPNKGVSFLAGRVPGFLAGTVERYLSPRPVFDHDICIRCGDCYRSCPPEAISMTPYPEVDLSICIKCYCCQELCPVKAVTVKRRPLVEWILDRF